MSDRTVLDDWLDQWEELQEQGEPVSLDQFIAAHCDGAPEELVDQLRDKVRRLKSMNFNIRAAAAGATSSDASLNTPGGSPVKSRFQPGQEPVFGYRLEAWLGGGGFGEVWRATSPGGFAVALKFVRLEHHVGETERRALETIKQVRHSHLLAVVGSWEMDDYLVVAMELADRTLLDRLKEAQQTKRPGIPRDELLEYMTEAAKGLDHLHSPRPLPDGKQSAGLQHQDIKPANMLLSGGSLKVADFGLVRVLKHAVTAHTGSMTYAYAAPEFCADQTSAQSDQYSLAVSYCELRGGRLPFTGNAAQLMKGHLHQEPDLSMLPAEEHAVVRRALAKKPDDRWPSCGAFVEALHQAALSAARPTTPPRKRWVVGASACVAAPFVIAVELAVLFGGTRSAPPDQAAARAGLTGSASDARVPVSVSVPASADAPTLLRAAAKGFPVNCLTTAVGKLDVKTGGNAGQGD